MPEERDTIPNYDNYTLVCYCDCGCDQPNPNYPGSSHCDSCAAEDCRNKKLRRAAWLTFEFVKLPLYSGMSLHTRYVMRKEFMEFWDSLPMSKEE